MYGFKGIERLLNDINERRRKAEKKAYNKKVGYAPKCKVCNSEYLDDIERLREEDYTYEEILEELGITDISIMSLSRHFKNHYPNSQAYKDKQQLEMLENIREAYIKYPFLENYFKNRSLEYLECFNNDNGFCTDSFNLCEFIPAGTVSNCNKTVWQLKHDAYKKIENETSSSYYSRLDKDKENSINIQYEDYITECLNCKNEINEKRINLLESIITYHFLNIPPENKELYFNLLEFDGNPDEFIQTLEEGNTENPAK